MSWPDRLKAEIPRDEIPAFLADLQSLVAALREERAWALTPTLRQHPDLVLDYMTPGDKREQVKRALGDPKDT